MRRGQRIYWTVAISAVLLLVALVGAILYRSWLTAALSLAGLVMVYEVWVTSSETKR
jgi:CHASE2 domain-containing sensor protein